MGNGDVGSLSDTNAQPKEHAWIIMFLVATQHNLEKACYVAMIRDVRSMNRIVPREERLGTIPVPNHAEPKRVADDDDDHHDDDDDDDEEDSDDSDSDSYNDSYSERR